MYAKSLLVDRFVRCLVRSFGLGLGGGLWFLGLALTSSELPQLAASSSRQLGAPGYARALGTET